MRKNCVFSVRLLGGLLLGIGGCGDDADALETLTGTWSILSINRKTPAAWLLPVLAGEARFCRPNTPLGCSCDTTPHIEP